MNLSISEIIKLLIRGVWERKVLVSVLYVITSAAFLTLALLWPKVYTSSSTILVDQQSILRPLMEGTAETTSAQNRVKAAREVIFSRESMVQILASSSWFESEPTEKEKDSLRESIKKRTEFKNLGNNLILISFQDSEPKRAFETAKLMANIFIEQSLNAKRNESKSAHDFIATQAAEYHKKLKDAELAIKNFRSKNVEASPIAETAADERLLQLKRQIESVGLELYEEESKLEARRKQLSGESGTLNDASIVRENQLRTRVNGLEERIAELRLVYMDNYPDIVQFKGQIESLQEKINYEVEARKTGVLSENKQLRNGPIAQELRSQILRSVTNISTLKSREKQLIKLRNTERETKEEINLVKAEVAELTRDYDVNQRMYQRLLSQRENAYISMNIDIKNQGLMIKIQESASLPVNPKGIRFAHIILAGLLFSFVVPIGASFGLNQIDRKVRDARIIIEELKIPVLASVYSATTPSQMKSNFLKISLMILLILSVWGVYGHFIFLKMTGEV